MHHGTIYCDTYNGSKFLGTTQTNIGIDVNGKKSKPIINSVDIVDTNKTLPTGLTTTALTGNNQKLIKYISDVKGTINAVARNSSTLVYFVFRNDNDKIGTGPSNVYTLKDIQNSHFVILAKDSRGLSAIENKDLEMVDYTRLNMSKFSLNRESPTSNKVILNVEGNWFNGSFGTATNTLQAVLKYKEVNTQNYTTIPLKLTISANTFKLNNYQIVSDFDYQKNYDFIIEIRDKCMIQERTQIIQKGIPVFDYGEHDFRVNEILNVKGIANIKNLNVNGKGFSITNGTYTVNSMEELKKIGNSFIGSAYNLLITPAFEISGMPFGTSTFCIFGEQTSVNYGCQIAISDAFVGIKYRNLIAGTWSEWKSIQAI